MKQLQSVCAFLLLCTSVQVTTGALLGGLCPTANYTANVSIWDVDGDQSEASYYPWVMNGYADMRALSQFIAQQGADFEDYMGTRVGHFQVLDPDTGNIDPWNSLIFKLNVLTGPILAAPYEIERTSANADDWDAWWEAVHALSPANYSATANCDSSATSSSFKPYAISFPSAYLIWRDGELDSINPLVNSYSVQPFEELLTRMWQVETVDLLTQPKTVIEENGATICGHAVFLYSKAVSQSTTTSSSETVSSDTKISYEIDLSESASLSLGVMSESISSTIKTSVSESIGVSYTTGTTHTNTTTTTVTWGATPEMLPNSVLNITAWTAQVSADIYVTGDALYPGNTTGIMVLIQGDGLVRNDLTDDIPALLSVGEIVTLDQIKTVAKMAMHLIGADWSDTFLNTLVSSSVGGKADSIVGDTAIIEIWACDMDSVPAYLCDKTLSKLYPPQLSTCPGSRRAVVENPGSFEQSMIMSLFPDDPCYSLVPVEEHDNRWYVVKNEDCTTDDSAS
eukprot:Clim_evm7s10 gene=Clim_evmTU7s10